MKLSSPIARFRLVMGLFIAGLVVSGLTAFPLLAELNAVCRLLGLDPAAPNATYGALGKWILAVRNGLDATYSQYPWMAYGTDWLAFGHIVIAIFFIGPFVNPVANRWVLQAGMIACAGVLPLALICGPLRGIPFGWRLIDCSFGIFGVAPLIYCHRLLPRIAAETAAMQAGKK